MLQRLLRRGKRAHDAPRTFPAAPPGCRIYAVGDIHGRLDLLEQIHQAILEDARSAAQLGKTCVYIGDYVDRGGNSRGVINRLLSVPLPGFRAVHLLGNHEEMMLRFLDDVSIASIWLANGGDATLDSYGIEWRLHAGTDDMETVRRTLRESLPTPHLKFLRGLSLSHVAGDYLFVHAGIRPGRPVTQQDDQDLLWIRNEFLDSEVDHGKVVVHGHSISPAPDVRANRIGIDTGAFASGKLTCLALEGPNRWFLQTG